MTESTPARHDVIGLLGRQHKQISGLFAKVEMSTSQQRRRVAFEQLVRLLATHETVEEEIVHPALRHVDGGEGVAGARLREERAAKELLAELDATGPDADGFAARLRELHHLVLEHAANEEREEFPLLRSALPAARLAAMAESARAAAAAAPTHPHPGVESAGANVLGGPFLAVADRVRDAIRKAATGTTTGTDGRD